MFQSARFQRRSPTRVRSWNTCATSRIASVLGLSDLDDWTHKRRTSVAGGSGNPTGSHRCFD